MNKRCIVVRHAPHEDLGAFDRPFFDAGFDVRAIDSWKSSFSAADAVNAPLLVVMGGPMGVYEAATYPFLDAEIEAIEERLRRNQPTLGVCLGAQLIARAAGAEVFPGGSFELGFAPVELTPEGKASCLAPLGQDPLVLHWHTDTFELPRGATRLASSALYREQAFCIGSQVLALQFHLEAGGEGFEHWIDAGTDDLRHANADADSLRKLSCALGPGLERKAAAVISRWLSDIRF